MYTERDETTIATNVEVAAEQVSEAKGYLVELDRRQNQFREAKRKIMNTGPFEENLWVLCSGSTFVSCELDQSDTIKYFDWRMRCGEDDIEAGREDLKQKVANLAELEGPDSALAELYKGFNLKPTAS
ncbi:p53 and DNA damage-regulated protein 1 [Strigomonas culicis]|uniref:p53 and DNA damage-regulated protein 1 n=1 Tax=Strigomonas culicis TaxID=28005 RepID=S9U670_9TRYP|nr:p53 and DNA damage-regulated protein 1 [Strigomonas culicis]EPY37273.1 p53 and DNA damage-regulated protein 1 [Strigomonas culicis]|eukprot:EPY24254.1 p53 and DNA damage-regulated protein 1 [Strigomonas culicis]